MYSHQNHLTCLFSLSERLKADNTIRVNRLVTVEVKGGCGCDQLALVDDFTPVEDNIGLLETRFDVDAVFEIVCPKDVTGSMNLTLLSLYGESLEAREILDYVNDHLECLFLLWHSGFQFNIGRADLDSLQQNGTIFIIALQQLVVFLWILDFA
ncbi:hypothetical protein Tco_1041657 [Tanacetum coccineum]|uniref:Uncharacterized protein n=1 Tax=Tanacetum coccineum TaxID=301880 RepID=A0ABQ5GJ67_9ASTR